MGQQWLYKHEDGSVLQGDQGSLNGNEDDDQQHVQIVRWEETWERKKLTPWGDPILQAWLTARHQDLKFYDMDSDNNNMMTAHKMVFRKERGENRYDVFAIMPGFNHELPVVSPDNVAFWQPQEVNKDLFDCMRAYYQDVQTDSIKTYDIGDGSDSDTE